ncbi:MAG: VWA domain-containing protein [Blastocatellia bacterium]
MRKSCLFLLLLTLLGMFSAFARQQPPSGSGPRLSLFIVEKETMSWFGSIPWMPDSLAKPILDCGGNTQFRQRAHPVDQHSFTCTSPDRPRLTRTLKTGWRVRKQVEEMLRKQPQFELAALANEADVVLWLQVSLPFPAHFDREERARLRHVKSDQTLGVYALAVPAQSYKQIGDDPPALRKVALWEGRAVAGISEDLPLAGLVQCFQQAMMKREGIGSELTLKLDTNMVTTPVTAVDQEGKPVANLTQRDFRIAENGVEQEIAQFNAVEETFDVALILDASNSASSRLEEIKRAATAFVERMRPQDRVMVVSFDYRVCVESEFTADREQIRRAINALKTSGGFDNNVYDSVELTLTERLKKLRGRKAIVLFTDGSDGSGHYATEQSLLEKVAESNAPVHVILYDTYDEAARAMRARAPATPASDFQFLKETYQKTADLLLDAASLSGGRLYRAEVLSNLENSFSQIAEDLRNQYWLSYYPKDDSRNVFNRVIQVTAGRPGVTIRSAKVRPNFSLSLETGDGTVVARAGEKTSGWISVPELRNADNSIRDAGTNIPTSVIHGAAPGPVLAVVAGNHAHEHAPIIALQQLLQRLDPKRITGTLILVHTADMRSFMGRGGHHYGGVDFNNLNRAYPGKADGALPQRVAYQITNQVIERCDYLIDLHGGDGGRSLHPHTYRDAGNGGKDVIEWSKQLALAFGLDHIVTDGERYTDLPASMIDPTGEIRHIEQPFDPATSFYCSMAAARRGKPAITVEAGGSGASDKQSIEAIERGVMSVMRRLKMIEGEPEKIETPVFIDRVAVLRSDASGIFYPLVERNRTVAKGTSIGYVTDFFGKRIFDLRAPFSGAVLYIIATPPTSKGEPLAMIGHIVASER